MSRATTAFALMALAVAWGIAPSAKAANCESLLGKWMWFIGGEVTVNRDGTFTQQSGNAGTWECTDGPRGRFTMRWRDGGFINSLQVSPDGSGLSSTDMSQTYVTAQRTGGPSPAAQTPNPPPSSPPPRTPTTPGSVPRIDESCCQENFRCETARIEAEFARKLEQCHRPNNAGCLSEATSTKADQLRRANEALRHCDRIAIAGGTAAPSPDTPSSGNAPPIPSGSDDEFHSTDPVAGFSAACQMCVAEPGDAPEQPPGGTLPDSAPTECVPDPTPQVQTRLRRAGNGLLDTMAAMGQQTDRALNGMGEAVVETLAYYAQPNAKVWEQRRERALRAASTIVDYLNVDDATRRARLQAFADQAVKDFLRDPAGNVGKIAAGILTGRAVESIASAASRCINTTERAAAAAAAVAKAEKAAERQRQVLVGTIQTQDNFPNPCVSPVNPRGVPNQCHTGSWAEILTEQTGFQWTVEHFKEVLHDAGTPWEQIYRVQSKQWGDRVFSNLSPTAQVMQHFGVPRMMKSRQVIKELQDAGNGAEGIVTVKRADGALHTFRGKNVDGRVLFKEAGGGMVGDFNPANNGSPIVQTLFYRVSGQDRVR